MLVRATFVLWLWRQLKATLFDSAKRAVLLAGLTSVALGLLVGWACTSPSWSMGINWDTSGTLSEIARESPWARTPWNSHYGVSQVYWLAVHLARPLGLTALDGIRVLNGLALSLSALTLCLCAIRLGVRPTLAVLLAGVYLTSWGTLILTFTWEDNILFHPPALAVLALCLVRIHEWRWQDSLAAGLLAGWSSLMSWQGAAFALPAMYVALFLAGPTRPWWQRLRDGVCVPAGLIAARFVWVGIYWLTAHQLSFRELLVTAFERPSPNFLPKDFAGWITLVGRWREGLAHMGLGITHELGPGIRDSVIAVPQLKTIGVVLLGLSVLLWVITCLVFRRRIRLEFQFVAMAFLALTLSAAIYLDLPADKYKRYDYLPMIVSLGLLVLAGWVAMRGPSRWLGRGVAFAIVAVIGAQLAVGYHWNRQWYARLPTARPANRIAHSNLTWFAYFRSLKRAAPQSCAFVFAFDEVAWANDNLEILAALVSELPNPAVIAAPPRAHTWPRPLPLIAAEELAPRMRGCEWVSPAARTRLPAR
jgi:hypothetical protein